MFRYILKRLMWAIPTWLMISVIVFALSQCASNDEVTARYGEKIEDDVYAEKKQMLGLDKPTFYCSVTPQPFPDTLRFILRQDQQNAVEALIWRFGCGQQVIDYHSFIRNLQKKIAQTSSNTEGGSFEEKKVLFNNIMSRLLIISKPEAISFSLTELTQIADSSAFKSDARQAVELFQNILKQQNSTALYVPKFRWHGLDNQYHRWLSRFLKGDFGLTKNEMPVHELLKSPLSKTFVLGLFALILAYVVGILLGILAATSERQWVRRWLVRILFGTYSLPTFWIAMMAAMFLATPYYGLQLFPNIGSDRVVVGASVLEEILTNLDLYILPIICIAIHPITVIARHLQDSLQDVLQMDYIKAAKAKGISNQHIIWRHALRNAATPLITLLGRLLPSLVSGAFVVEMIFNINGMGQTVVRAMSGDWAVVYAVLLIVSAVILLSNLVADLLYRWLNPRLTF